MHGVFYVIAVLVTALAIYSPMKRIEETEKQNEQADSPPVPVDEPRR